MPRRTSFNDLNDQIAACERCPRLREWCHKVARDKRAAYRDQTYHGRPVPNFGDPAARLLLLGLAPAAHGANRTGRMFTGDRSGDFLFKQMHLAGLANQPHAVDGADGLTLRGAAITAVCHCAPPANKPKPEEIANCAEHLDATFAALPNVAAVLCLGRIAFDAAIRYARRATWIPKNAAPTSWKFAHGARFKLDAGPTIICSYHPSQQNTFTGRLTETMLLDVLQAAAREAGCE